MNLPPEIISKIPERVVNRLQTLEVEIQTLITKAMEQLVTKLPNPLSFEFTHSAPSDILTDKERAQSISFITRYEHLPSDSSVQLVEHSGTWHIGNFPFLRHALNDYRPIIQNKSDSVYYRNIHSVWYPMLLRANSADGMTIRSYDIQKNDITPTFAKWIGERLRAISIVLDSLDYDYLYNGILQHSDDRFAHRFLEDYISGEINYIFWKHMHVLNFIKEMLRPYYTLINQVSFPKMGAL